MGHLWHDTWTAPSETLSTCHALTGGGEASDDGGGEGRAQLRGGACGAAPSLRGASRPRQGGGQVRLVGWIYIGEMQEQKHAAQACGLGSSQFHRFSNLKAQILEIWSSAQESEIKSSCIEIFESLLQDKGALRIFSSDYCAIEPAGGNVPTILPAVGPIDHPRPGYSRDCIEVRCVLCVEGVPLCLEGFLAQRDV